MLAELAATPIGDLTLRKPAHASPDDKLIEVVATMREHRRGATIVGNESEPLQGIFTERDLMLRVDHSTQSWHEQSVKEVMTKNPKPISSKESVATGLRRMKEGGFRHLPVVDENGKPIGLLSIRDIIGYIAENFPEEFINLPPDPNHEAHRRWGG